MMFKYVVLFALAQCCLAQQYQQKVAPGVPPQQYQQNPNYQQPPPPPPPQQQYQPPPPQQQYQQPQQQQFQQPPPQQQQQYQQHNVQQPNMQQVPQQQHPGGHGHGGDPQLLNVANIAHERDHIQEHMEVPIDTSKMSEQELQFHYFKMHDADNNNKLDGCELIKSLIHWHEQEEKTERVVRSDSILEDIVETTLGKADKNNDGYIDYAEFKLVADF